MTGRWEIVCRQIELCSLFSLSLSSGEFQSLSPPLSPERLHHFIISRHLPISSSAAPSFILSPNPKHPGVVCHLVHSSLLPPLPHRPGFLSPPGMIHLGSPWPYIRMRTLVTLHAHGGFYALASTSLESKAVWEDVVVRRPVQGSIKNVIYLVTLWAC